MRENAYIGFGSESKLELHKKSAHLGLKPFICDLCHEAFVTNSDKNSHIRRRHSKDKPYQCSNCAKTFGSTTLLEHHIARIHELRNCETCPYCGKIYSRLQAHLLTCSVKGAERIAHPCSGCDKTFLDKQSLKRHIEKGKCEEKYANQYVVKRTRYT